MSSGQISHPKSRIPNPNGFTLLELLIALTILSMLMTVVFGGLHMGIRAWEKGEDNAENNQELRIVLDLISQQIKSIYPYVFREGEEEVEEFLAFTGNSDSIRFISTLGATSSDAAGLSFVSYFVDTSKELMLYEKRIFKKEMFQEELDKENSVVLISRISEFSLKYQDDERDWFDGWDVNERKSLPEAIKLTLTYEGGPSQGETTTVSTIPLMTTSLPGMGEL